MDRTRKVDAPMKVEVSRHATRIRRGLSERRRPASRVGSEGKRLNGSGYRAPVAPNGVKRILTGLRDRLPMSARRPIERAARFWQTFPDMTASFGVLASWGYRPGFVVDVGAYEGEWTRLFRRTFPEARSLMVEPLPAKQVLLAAQCSRSPGRTRLSGELLGATDGAPVEFFEMETGSSVLPELGDVPRTVVTREITRLDTVLESHADWGSPDFLKLDVQGFELEVLKGATRCVEGCDFVLLETSLLPYNDGAPLLAEVVAHLAGLDFTAIDFCSQLRRGDGALVQTDLLLLNQASPLVRSWAGPVRA